MKRISFFILIASAVTVFSISSCYKDELIPSVNDNIINTTPYTIYLTANHWNKIVAGVYTCPFLNIIPTGYRNNRDVKIYLLKADQKIQINYPIFFMSGELSSTTTATDVTINYRYFGELPFNYLDIKVEIE